MKAGGLLSMTACYFVMRDVLIRYHRRERIRLTQKIVFEVSDMRECKLQRLIRWHTSHSSLLTLLSAALRREFLGVLLFGVYEHLDG